MKFPIKLNPTAVIVGADGRFTRDGFNLISDLVRAVDDINILPAYLDTDIADETHPVNTSGKRIGRAVLDSVNHVVFTARGAGINDEWDSADGGTTVTPA